jgi:hypothetical protein
MIPTPTCVFLIGDDVRHLVRELKEVLPVLVPQLTAQERLHLPPGRKSVVEFRLTGVRQAQPPFASVFAQALGHPALSAHDCQSARQSCAIHRQHFTELALRHLSGTR